MEEPRPLRTSPFYMRQRELGAYFLEASGWERPQWYAANEALLADYDVPEMEEWAGRYWSPIVGAEHLATRERVALYDMASLKKAEVSGPGALEFLQGLNTNQLDKPVGSVTYTLMLDGKGGVTSDITVARLGETHFQLGLNGPRDIEWMGRHLPADGSGPGRDISGGAPCVGGGGRRARARRAAGHRVDGAAPAGRRLRAGAGHLGRDPLRRGVGAAGQGALAGAQPRRPLQRGVRVLQGQAHLRRRGARLGLAGLLRRRAWLGALRLGGPGPQALGPPVRGGASPRRARRRGGGPLRPPGG